MWYLGLLNPYKEAKGGPLIIYLNCTLYWKLYIENISKIGRKKIVTAKVKPVFNAWPLHIFFSDCLPKTISGLRIGCIIINMKNINIYIETFWENERCVILVYHWNLHTISSAHKTGSTLFLLLKLRMFVKYFYLKLGILFFNV